MARSDGTLMRKSRRDAIIVLMHFMPRGADTDVGVLAPTGAARRPGNRVMASADTDRNLLFGLLALQNGLVDQARLVGAFQAWTLDKGRSLAEHLVTIGHLDAD